MHTSGTGKNLPRRKEPSHILWLIDGFITEYSLGNFKKRYAMQNIISCMFKWKCLFFHGRCNSLQIDVNKKKIERYFMTNRFYLNIETQHTLVKSFPFNFITCFSPSCKVVHMNTWKCQWETSYKLPRHQTQSLEFLNPELVGLPPEF